MNNRANNPTAYGPDNPHSLSRLKTELVWEGKYDEYGNRRPVKLPTSPLPLQRIETIDEPHDRLKATQLSLFDEASFHQKAHRDDFRNMLIWGDNKLALAALLEQFRGKVDLIYIDPPFDVGADFTMQVQIGDEDTTVEKEQSILEAVAYRSFDVYNLGRYERQWWQLDRLKGADEEHRNLVLKFYKAASLNAAPHPLLHGTRHSAFVHVDRIDGIFTENELRAAAEAARAAGGRELHCLAWEFEMELTLKKQAVEAETGLTIRLKYIPREIMEPNRTEAQFSEAGYLEAKASKQRNKVDVELVRFAWHEGKPFEHHWQDFRTRKDRSLKTRTDIGWEYAEKGKHKICVKVIDVFGVDTTAVVEIGV